MSRIIIYSLLLTIFIGCHHKNKIQHSNIDYTDRVIYKHTFDTIVLESGDTCQQYMVSFNNLVREYQTILDLAVNLNDTINELYSEIKDLKIRPTQNIVLPKKARKATINIIQGDNNTPTIDNSKTTQKVKDNSAIGNENQLTKTTKKNNWFWIFVAGALTWFVIQNVLWRVLKIYFPFLNFVK